LILLFTPRRGKGLVLGVVTSPVAVIVGQGYNPVVPTGLIGDMLAAGAIGYGANGLIDSLGYGWRYVDRVSRLAALGDADRNRVKSMESVMIYLPKHFSSSSPSGG
jgi:hypothetical protein